MILDSNFRNAVFLVSDIIILYRVQDNNTHTYQTSAGAFVYLAQDIKIIESSV